MNEMDHVWSLTMGRGAAETELRRVLVVPDNPVSSWASMSSTWARTTLEDSQ